jgi:hypothetical protein
MKGTLSSLSFLSGLLFGMSATSLLVSHFWQSRSLGKDDENSSSSSSSEMYLFERLTECSKQLEQLRYKEPSAAICTTIQKNKGGWNLNYYMDEWVDYHLALGFEQIFVYDNSKDFELKDWALTRNPNQVVVQQHWLAASGQRPECAFHDIKEGEERSPHDWIAFLDVDEFIVLKQNTTTNNIMELLNEVPTDAGGLSLNRYVFDFHNQMTYEPLPVTKRFQTRWTTPVDERVTTISRTKARIKPDYKTSSSVDTNGKRVRGFTNPNGPTNVAVIHHYSTKSVQEFMSRCQNGERATTKNDWTTHVPCSWPKDKAVRYLQNLTDTHGATWDDSAWQTLRTNVPMYGEKYGS